MKSFKKGEILTADRLNELITSATDASAAPGRSVAPRPGIHVQPGLARFNMQVEDSCTGQVSPLPDYAGLLKSVAYDSLDAPVINRGNLVLPLAHDYSPSDSSLPDESATGGVASINVVEDLKRPQINRGDIRLPLAQSTWPQTAEGAMYTPGLVYGVQYDNADACEGAVLPRIDQGIIHLPAGDGAELNLAHWDACTGIVTPGIVQPVIEDTRGNVVGRVLQGVPTVGYMEQSVDGRDTTVGLLRKIMVDTMGRMESAQWQPTGVDVTDGVLTLPYGPFGVYSTSLARAVPWAELKDELKETQVATWSQPVAGGSGGDVGSYTEAVMELVVGVSDNMLTFKIQTVS